MTNRREVLQVGIAAASGWPLAAEAARANASLPATSVLPLYKVIYDVRFPDSVAFARRAVELGAVVQAIEGDMTRVWYDDVYHRWKQGAAAIAGLTAHGPMFCFEQLALDQGMRMIFRAQHGPAPAGCTDHELSGPVGLLDAARDAVGSADWSARMAEVVTSCPRGRSEIASAASRTRASAIAGIRRESSYAGAPYSGAPYSRALYSWVIAPAVRV